MADGLSIASSVIALVAFAFKSSTVLYTTVRDFQSQDKNVRALKNELSDLRGVLESLADTVPLSEHEATQLAQLQETKESLRQCMSVVADAGETLTNERCNIFEDITMADSSYGISVSTVKDLVVARRLNLIGQARYLGGQISDESYQKTIDGLTHLDLESAKSYGKSDRKMSFPHGPNNRGAVSDGFEHYGRGHRLPDKQ